MSPVLVKCLHMSSVLIDIVETGRDSGRECKVRAGAGSSAPETTGFTTRVSAVPAALCCGSCS